MACEVRAKDGAFEALLSEGRPFADQAAYDGYNTHPHHVAFVGDRWMSEVEDFLEIDYAPL
jgi:hypothetical protein